MQQQTDELAEQLRSASRASPGRSKDQILLRSELLKIQGLVLKAADELDHRLVEINKQRDRICNLLKRIDQFDVCVRTISAELGVCHGGVDCAPDDHNGATVMLISAIRNRSLPSNVKDGIRSWRDRVREAIEEATPEDFAKRPGLRRLKDMAIGYDAAQHQ